MWIFPLDSTKKKHWCINHELIRIFINDDVQAFIRISQGATIVDQSVDIMLDPQYKLPPAVSLPSAV